MRHFIRMSSIIAVAVMMVFCVREGVAQDSRIPGGEYEDSIKTTVRNGKLVFESQDGNFRWWIDSRLQIDAAMYFENRNAMSNGATFRRLTFALKTMIYKQWDAELDIDFAEAVSTNSQIELRDMWIRYTFPSLTLSLQAGNFKEPFGLERLNSSRLLTFLERSAVSNAIPLGRRIGFSARYWMEDLGQITGAIMGHQAGTRIDKGQRDEGFSANIRASASPINEHGHVLHVGLAGSYKIPDATADLSANTIEVSARTETYVFNPKHLHTGDITDVDNYRRYGVELMYINGPFYVQSEFMGMTVHRWYRKLDINPKVNLRGGYFTATWVVTGETRYYYSDEGEVGQLEAPRESWGALEIAARYSITNLNDHGAGIHGGQSNQLMLGMNYYPNANIKLQINYSMVNLDQYATRKGNLVGDDDFSFLQFRIQASL